ncbi:PTS transporter subunit EIIC, partial [Klebsiella pneumoniae]|nr:PTS transporter subunit EIIC [Klebsiella pneumoniae]
FVAIATAFLSFLLGLLLPYVWQHIQSGIDALSVVVNGDNQAASTFIFGLVERALIPLQEGQNYYLAKVRVPSWFTDPDKKKRMLMGGMTVNADIV